LKKLVEKPLKDEVELIVEANFEFPCQILSFLIVNIMRLSLQNSEVDRAQD